MLAEIACVAIRQSFADRGATPAHRHLAYKCAALRAASRVSGESTIGNSPRTRSQRVNGSGLSAPCRTSSTNNEIGSPARSVGLADAISEPPMRLHVDGLICAWALRQAAHDPRSRLCRGTMEWHIDALVGAFSTDLYIDEDAARSAIKSQQTFNLMHLDSAIKVDLIARKNSEYRHAESERRKSVKFAGVSRIR